MRSSRQDRPSESVMLRHLARQIRRPGTKLVGSWTGAINMRNNGTRVELVWMRPHDHIGWAFAGPDELAGVARDFLQEGLELGEYLLFVAANPAEEAYRRLVA